MPSTRNTSMLDRKMTLAGLLITTLALAGGVSTMARPSQGYGDLIDTYCISQGRLRVPAHQSHCAMCHQTGTFDSLPAHRVQPNWAEFDKGRATGDFSFFCPGGSTGASPPASAATAEPAPSSGTGELSGSPTMSMHGRPPAPQQGAGSAASPEPHTMPMPAARPAPAPPSVADRQPVAPAEVEVRLTRFRDEIGIGQPEPANWTGFAESVRSAAAADRRAFTEQTPSNEPLDAVALVRQQERRLSARIAALRYVATAFTRLLPDLTEQQRKVANERFSLILEVL
ncbi:LTXXQ motif family protein [Enhydrobacter aerosaccus]|uniref:LTXXQ motif family protein n=1 Tax=Enhydrobacter aerosaccus TaxID=225324 RepID=A0A1T4SK51_9HYPH|nr:LTXXQ motif family protein [Enhydrobacter aerosaccus]